MCFGILGFPPTFSFIDFVVLSSLRENPVDVCEDSCRTYATMAVEWHGRNKYEVVETGPVGAGYLSHGRGRNRSRDLVLHLNFKAKIKAEPDAAVQTFFCEVIKPTNASSEGAKLVCVSCLGPSSELPGELNLTLHIGI